MKYVISGDGTINGFYNGKPFIITKDSEKYDEAKALLLEGKDISNYTTLFIGKKTEGIIECNYRIPTWDGIPMPTYLSERIMDIVDKGYQFDPIVKFMYNLTLNPREFSIVELIDFLRHKDLPLTEDGHFLAYKYINKDWTDVYTGKILNFIGSNPKYPMDLGEPDFNRSVECGKGLHVGSSKYVQDYRSMSEEKFGRFIIAKVDPKFAISVPRDHNFQKLRCFEYWVVAESPEGYSLGHKIYNESILKDEIENHKMVIEKKDLPSNWRSVIKDKFSKVISYIKGLGQ